MLRRKLVLQTTLRSKKKKTTQRSTMDYKIRIQINDKNMQKICTGCRDPFFVNINPSCTLNDLINKLLARPGDDILFLNGRDLLRESRNTSLDHLGIGNETILLLGHCGRFVIRFCCVNIQYMIEMDSSDTVRSLKQEIEKRTGIPMDEQKLEFNGVALLELGRTLLSYGIFRTSCSVAICDITIHLTEATEEDYISMAEVLFNGSIPVDFLHLDEVNPFSGEMHIKVETGYIWEEPLTMNCNPMGLLSTLKLILHRKFGFRNEQLVLFFNGKNLFEENSTVKSCGIESGATLLLGYKGRFLVGYRQSHIGDEFLVEIDCFDTIRMLKRKIVERTGGFEEHLLLYDADNELHDPERTLFSYGIFRRKIDTEIYHITVEGSNFSYRGGRYYF